MVEYNKVNARLSNSQLNKLKSAVKNQTEVTLRMTMKMFNWNNLPHELLLTTRQKTKLKSQLENHMSTDIKLSKAQITKLIQYEGFLGSLLSKLAGPLMNVAVSLAKNIVAPLGITAAVSATDEGIQKKIHGSGTTILIISNKRWMIFWKSFKLMKIEQISYWKELQKQLKVKQKNKRRIFRNVIRYLRS